MTETPNPTPNTPNEPARGETRPDLAQDLRGLADTLEQAVRGLASSEKTKDLEQEVRRGFGTLRSQTEAALKDAKVPEAAQEFSAQAKRVAGDVVQAKPAQQVLSIFAKGIAGLNQQLAKYITEEQTPGAPAKDKADEAPAASNDPSI